MSTRDEISRDQYGIAMKLIDSGLITPNAPSAEEEYFDSWLAAATTALTNKARSVLTDRQLEVIDRLYGFHLGGPTMDALEVADDLGVSVRSVYNLHHEALRNMRKLLGIQHGLKSNPRPRRHKANPRELHEIKERNALSWNVQEWGRPGGERYE